MTDNDISKNGLYTKFEIEKFLLNTFADGLRGRP